MQITLCSSGDNDDDILATTEYLNVTNHISIDGDGSKPGILDIKADCSWTIGEYPSWMSISKVSGTRDASINISCTPNPSSKDERSFALTVASTSGKLKRIVTISQAISSEYISVNTENISFNSLGESKVLSIESNAQWQIIGMENWFTLSRQEGSGNAEITVSAMKNESEISRTATITIQGNRTSVRVSLSQDGHVTILSLSPNNIEAKAVSAKYDLNVFGDAKWTVTSSSSWCTLSQYNGIGDTNIQVNVADNTSLSDRYAELIFTIATGTHKCTILQSAATLPDISSFSVSDIDKYSFKATASFSSEFDVYEYGVCYSTVNIEPTISDNCVKETISSKSDSMEFNISDIESGTIYYVRAYAISVVGIGYSDIETIITSGSMPKPDDNPTPSI